MEEEEVGVVSYLLTYLSDYVSRRSYYFPYLTFVFGCVLLVQDDEGEGEVSTGGGVEGEGKVRRGTYHL